MNLRFWMVIIAIVVVVGVIIGVGDSTKKQPPSNSNASATGASAAPASVVSDISSVSTTTFDTIGEGSANVLPAAISAPALTANQKPEIYYEGAEYCPYCATERWAMAVALARFGSFSNLKITKSSSSDVYPNTNTLSFYGSTYSSKYITFTPVELYTNIPDGGGYTTLQTPTAAEQNLATKYDTSGGIPFVDFGGKYTVNGASYNPQTLSGYSWAQIANSLANPNATIAKGVDGGANTLTAATCKLTNNQPENVCDSVIQGIEQKL